MKKNTQEYCDKHTKKTIQIYCLDSSCKENTKCCILCLQQDHQKCKDEYLLTKEELQNKLQFQNEKKQTKNILKQLNQYIEFQINETECTLQNTKNDFINSLNQENLKQQKLTPEIIKNLKRYHIVNQNNNNVILTSKFNSNPDKVQECMIIFEKTLQNKFNNFIQDFSKLSLMITNNLSLDDFLHHPSIKISELNNSILFERKQGDNAFNYYCSLYQQPLTQQSTFKINVINVYSNDRYIDIGIVKKTKYEQLQTNFINTYNSGGISYCGYSTSGGLSGKYNTKSSGDSQGLRPGYSFYMQFNPGQYIKFWDEQDDLALQKSMIGSNDEYYFFCTCYHSQTKFTIEKMD